jgi:2-iminobutanoate/2-iminopropanoate deaminase
MPPRHAIQTPAAPQAIGPYSQAIVASGFIFCSGQIPLDPATGELVTGDVTQQTHRVMENIKAVLDQAGADFSDVVKTTIYLTDLGDFSAVNEAYASYFADAPPARATVQVAALPKGSQVEIEAIAVG